MIVIFNQAVTESYQPARKNHHGMWHLVSFVENINLMS